MIPYLKLRFLSNYCCRSPTVVLDPKNTIRMFVPIRRWKIVKNKIQVLDSRCNLRLLYNQPRAFGIVAA